MVDNRGLFGRAAGEKNANNNGNARSNFDDKLHVRYSFIVKTLFRHARDWYAKFERPISSISLVGGFVFDALTLTRVDLFWENLWVVVHLIIVASCIFLINLVENEASAEHEKNPAKLHFWLINALQWFFGGLLSTFLVYYFRSGSLSVSWPFILLLLAAFVANERLKHHYSRLLFQVSLLFLSIFAYAIFIIPVLVHAVSTTIFFASGIASLVVMGIFLFLLNIAAREKFKGKFWPLSGVILGIFVGVNLLYYYNFIPPLPLSLKDAGIYHSLVVNAPGHYTVTKEPSTPWSFFQASEPIHIVAGDPLYAYTAVFSPASLNLAIVHEWQRYDQTKRSWITVSRIKLAVTGGADGGWRTFSEITPRAAGAWRLNVVTANGAVIGKIDFTVIDQSSEPALLTTTNN